MKLWFPQRLRSFRESVRWRSPAIAVLLAVREILRPFVYFYVWHIFETHISDQVPQPYGKEDAEIKVYTPKDRMMITEEQISAMGELKPEEARLRFAKGDLIAVAYVKLRPAGYMWVARSPGLELALDTYWIIRSDEAVRYGSFVLPEFRGRGIHSRLNSAVISYLFKNGITRILGSVSLLNPQSMSLPKHNRRAISMTVFITRIRGINWTIRKSFRAPLESRFSWPQR